MVLRVACRGSRPSCAARAVSSRCGPSCVKRQCNRASRPGIHANKPSHATQIEGQPERPTEVLSIVMVLSHLVPQTKSQDENKCSKCRGGHLLSARTGIVLASLVCLLYISAGVSNDIWSQDKHVGHKAARLHNPPQPSVRA